MIRSPLNYVGNKYKLLPDILNILPEGKSFLDLFAGGLTVSINVDYPTIYANDILTPLIDIYKEMQKLSIEDILEYIDTTIKEFNLNRYQKDTYLTFRSHYNKTKYPLDLLILTIFSFNNLIRFNNKGDYNVPHGTIRSTYTTSIKQNLMLLKQKLNNITLLNKDFTQIPLTQDVIYCDPPYLISNAEYNKQWNKQKELQLYNILQNTNKPWILSNILIHKNQSNNTLQEFIQDNNYNIIYLNKSYNNANYKIKYSSYTQEVLITNFKTKKQLTLV